MAKATSSRAAKADAKWWRTLANRAGDAPFSDDEADEVFEAVAEAVFADTREFVEAPDPQPPAGGWTRDTLATALRDWVKAADDDDDDDERAEGAGDSDTDDGDPCEVDWLDRIAREAEAFAVKQRDRLAQTEWLAARIRDRRALLPASTAERVGREERRLTRELESVLSQIRLWTGLS